MEEKRHVKVVKPKKPRGSIKKKLRKTPAGVRCPRGKYFYLTP